jgi:hypothetical protein
MNHRKLTLFYVNEAPHIPGFRIPTEKEMYTSAKSHGIINTKFD